MVVASAMALLNLLALQRLGLTAYTGLMAPSIVMGGWIWLANSARRLRDANLPTSWLLAFVLPAVGVPFLLAMAGFARGTVGPNPHGPDPRGRTAPSV